MYRTSSSWLVDCMCSSFFFLPFFKFFTILNAGISRNHLKIEEGNVYFHNNNQAVMNKVFRQDFLMVISMISMYSKKM